MQETTIFDDIAWMNDPVPRGAALNMAIDETLLAGSMIDGLPLLRVYRWDQPTVSIGYFERMEPARQAFPARQMVRRWTGGGIVEHGSDLTYSLLVPRALIPPEWRAGVAYQHIHRAVALALKAAGLEHITFASGQAADRSSTTSMPSHECFESPVAYDVMLAGQKIAGAAQRRTRYGLLHQGSVRGHDENDFRARQFGPGTPLHHAICARLPAAFGRRPEPRTLTDTELEQALRLATTRYGTSAWLEKF